MTWDRFENDDEGALLAVLDRFVAMWRADGAPLSGHLRPGLSDAQIDELCLTAGVVLPDDVRTLYRWHDGVERALFG